MFERISAIIVDRLEDKRIIQMETKEVCAYGAFVNKKLSHLANKKVSQL